MMNRIASMAVKPASGLTSVRAISASDLPFLRMLAVRMVKSCTAPPRTTPTRSHRIPGAQPN